MAFYPYLSCSKKGLNNSGLVCVSQKTRKHYGPEKPFVKLRPAYSVKLGFSYVVKGVNVKITAKFRDTGLFRFEDTKNPDLCNTSAVLKTNFFLLFQQHSTTVSLEARKPCIIHVLFAKDNILGEKFVELFFLYCCLNFVF